MRKSLASCVTVATLLASGLVRAEDVKEYPQCAHEPTETDLTAAKGAFQAGNASFDEADYPRAIVYWEDAYRRDCTAHALLLNLARAYELNGNKPQAVVALQTYIARVPASPDKDKILRRLEVVQKQIDAERAQATAAAAPVSPPPATPTLGQTGAATPAPAPEEPENSGKRPILPLVVAGAGAGIAIVGTVLFITAKSDLADADERCPNRKQCKDPTAASDGNSARRRVNVGGGLAVGGVVVAGGSLAWYFLTPKSGASTSSNSRVLTPIAAPNFVGMSYSGTF